MHFFRFLPATCLLLTLAISPVWSQSQEQFDPKAPADGTTGALSSQPWQLGAAVLFDNGPFETSPGESVLENTSLGLLTLGAGAQAADGNMVADDFTVTDALGWRLDQVTGFTYQTGSANVSTVTDVHVRIYNANPSTGGVVVFDGSGGCLNATTETNVFRFAESAGFNMVRAIFSATCTLGVDLPMGTYWMEFAFSGSSLFSGPWIPPVSILGSSPVPGANAVQFLMDTGVWAPITDAGNSDALAIPFVIEGSVIVPSTLVQDIPTLGQWGMIALTLSLIGLAVFTLSRQRQLNF